MTDRWQCDKCGATCPWPVVAPVRCSCGHIDRKPRKSRDVIGRSILRQLQTLCDDCEHFGKHQRGNEERTGCGLMDKPCNVEGFWYGKIPCPDGRDTLPAITGLVAVTSLSSLPHHMERQAVCLDSWKHYGLEVVSVNTAAEVVEMRQRYPQVSQWVECNDVATQYDRPLQKINHLADVAISRGETILLINSDIEIYGKQSTLLDRMKPNTLVAGMRHNYQTRRTPARREEWGLDAFVLTPEMAASLPRIPLAIGKPVWDYWLPLHFRSLGYSVDLISEPLFFHQSHAAHWTQREWSIGGDLLLTHYGESLPDGGREFRRSLD